MNAGTFKMFIYGMTSFVPGDEFESIFKQLLENQTISAVFKLVEKKGNIIHECFAGDLLYQHKEKLFSSRGCLIRQKLSYPTLLDSENNRVIFEAVSMYLHSYNVVKGQTAGELVRTGTWVPTGTLVDESRDLIPNFASQIDDFGLIEIIGEGTVKYIFHSKWHSTSIIKGDFVFFQFGVVYKAWAIARQEFVAIKLFRNSIYGTAEFEEVKQEAEILRMVNNEYAIKLYDLKQTVDQIYLAFPLYQKDLKKFIYEDEYAQDGIQMKKIIFMILSGLQGLHEAGIVHRDIKPSNMLVNGDASDLKICDLGLARMHFGQKKMESDVGTTIYQAPEIFFKEYDRKVDVWVSSYSKN